MKLIGNLLFVAMLLGVASERAAEQTAAAESERPLTNADVIALVRAGLGDEVVIAKIRQSKAREFDVSTDALIGLQKAGVSSEVIAALLGSVTPAPSPPQASPGGHTNLAFDARAPRQVVVDDNTMLLDARDGAKRVLMTSGRFHRVGVMGAGATFMVYPGAKSSVRTTDRRPTLTFVHETPPAQYVFLTRVESDLGDNDRSVKIGSFFKRGGGFTSKNNGKPDPDWTVAYDVSDDSPNVWHVKPKADLQPGEYALYFQGGLWAFGVD